MKKRAFGFVILAIAVAGIVILLEKSSLPEEGGIYAISNSENEVYLIEVWGVANGFVHFRTLAGGTYSEVPTRVNPAELGYFLWPHVEKMEEFWNRGPSLIQVEQLTLESIKHGRSYCSAENATQ